MFISSFWSTLLIWVPVSFPSLLVPYAFSFISLSIAFIFPSNLWPYSTNSVSILIPVFWTVHLIGWLSLRHLVVFFLELWSVLSFGPFFFFLSLCACYVVRGGALGVPQGGATHLTALWRCVWGRVWEGTRLLAQLSVSFQSLPPPPKSKLGPSGADSQVGRFVFFLGPCGPLHGILLWGWELFTLLPQPPQVFSVRGLRLYFLPLQPWVVQSVLLPSCSSWSSSHHLAAHPLLTAACLCPSYWSGWVFLLYLLCCQTSIQFNFLLVLVGFCF